MNPPELVDAIMDPMMMAMGTMLGKILSHCTVFNWDGYQTSYFKSSNL